MTKPDTMQAGTATAFQIYSADNVATLLSEAAAGAIQICGAESRAVHTEEPIELGHKVALRPIHEGETIVKFGVPIGIASQAIREGAWVHLHNCRSQLDERSGTLDLHTGLPGDIHYE